MSRRDLLIAKLSATMDPDNARALVEEVIRESVEDLEQALWPDGKRYFYNDKPCAKEAQGLALHKVIHQQDAERIKELEDQLRVVGDTPGTNTPSTSMDRHGVVAARGADPDPSPDQLLRDELIRDRDTWSQACASAIRELREEREQLRSLIQTWRQEGLTARRPMDHDAINACADDLEALLPPDAPQEK